MGKGCGTCKRRKVKCDETHPKCTRCHAAGIECTGFARRLRFVDENPRIKRKEGVIHAQSHEFSTKAGSGHLSSHSSKICSHQLLIPVPFLADSLPLTAFKDDISISFLVSKFFETEHPHFAERYSCGLPIEWIYELIKTPQKPRLKSWDALATIVYGQANRSHDLIRSALGLYAQALSELRMQLSDPHIRQSHSVLASITALYMYQVRTKNMPSFRMLLTTVDNCVENREFMDVACRWAWWDSEVERSAATEVLCYKKNIPRAPYYAGKRYLMWRDPDLYLIEYRLRRQLSLASVHFFANRFGERCHGKMT